MYVTLDHSDVCGLCMICSCMYFSVVLEKFTLGISKFKYSKLLVQLTMC